MNATATVNAVLRSPCAKNADPGSLQKKNAVPRSFPRKSNADLGSIARDPGALNADPRSTLTDKNADPGSCALEWCEAIHAADPGDDADIHRLRDLSLRFIAGEWADLAIGHGWSCTELFGVFPASLTFAKRRGDCLGLIPAISLVPCAASLSRSGGTRR